jgi:hypothetical protein
MDKEIYEALQRTIAFASNHIDTTDPKMKYRVADLDICLDFLADMKGHIEEI